MMVQLPRVSTLASCFTNTWLAAIFLAVIVRADTTVMGRPGTIRHIRIHIQRQIPTYMHAYNTCRVKQHGNTREEHTTVLGHKKLSGQLVCWSASLVCCAVCHTF